MANAIGPKEAGLRALRERAAAPRQKPATSSVKASKAKPKRDRTAYQRTLMRKRRAEGKA